MPSRVRAWPRSCGKRVVLCIDDHEPSLHLRKLILETAGYKVITARSGRLALRFLQRHAVQLVIVDYSMPEMDGEAVAREIRRAHPQVPIVMLSGQIDVPASVSSAVDAFVSKEEAPIVLLKRLNALSKSGPGKRPPSSVGRHSIWKRRQTE